MKECSGWPARGRAPGQAEQRQEIGTNVISVETQAERLGTFVAKLSGMQRRATLPRTLPLGWHGVSVPDFTERRPVAETFADLFGQPPAIAISAYDGSQAGPADAPARVILESPTALRRIVKAPGGLGLARAYIAGDLRVEGDLIEAVRRAERLGLGRPSPRALFDLLREAGASSLRRLEAPAVEIRHERDRRVRRRNLPRHREARTIAHHYDISSVFYRIVLGPSMTDSGAAFRSDAESLAAAQEHKHDLVCRKLGLAPGMRLLDLGCGWGTLAIHAARHYGVEVVGVTPSWKQAELAHHRVVEAGLWERVEIRVQDYCEVVDGPYDGISSVGLFEHLGIARRRHYADRAFALLRPGGRLVSQSLDCNTRGSSHGSSWLRRAGFFDRYVSPGATVPDIASVVAELERIGFETCDVEGMRDSGARTMRAWSANLEAQWDDAVRAAGIERARMWRLLLAAGVVGLESGRLGIHQVLAIRPDGTATALPARSQWDAPPVRAA